MTFSEHQNLSGGQEGVRPVEPEGWFQAEPKTSSCLSSSWMLNLGIAGLWG